ncbi:hypothetical protein [Archangium lipolyticum]|uniref:hypothetical protein n=1 Tax=Archangium lipolyticum TaxID=2970465 RepID=UPI00214A29EF|nr:hypothetical protein [Archangium lipolyticum]
MDEKSLGKVLDRGLIDLYEQAAARAARARSTLARAAPADECIPEVIDVLVTFTGDIAALKALGFRGGSGVRTPDGLHILEGRLDPTLLGELVAIPHLVSVRRAPKAHPELN